MNMIAALLLMALAPGEAKVTVRVPDVNVAGLPFPVRIDLEAPADGASLEGWQLTPAAFSLDGKPLAAHGSEPAVALTANQKKTVQLDLSSQLKSTKGDFELTWGTLPAKKVRRLEAAPKDLKFMDEAS